MGPQRPTKITNSKPIPHIPLPFREVIADVLKIKPLEKPRKKKVKGPSGVQNHPAP
jgi:hypothetical protein